MTKNVKLDLSMKEIIAIAKNKWKIIALAAIIFAIVCGLYGVVVALNSSDYQPSDNEEALYQKNLDYYNYEMDSQETLLFEMKEKWVGLSEQIKNDPIMKMDPNDCKKIQIVLRFEDGTGSHKWTVENWINLSDDDVLFGEKAGKLKQYKGDLIQVMPRGYSIGYSNDIRVDLYETPGFDIDKASEYLIGHFKKQAKAQQINLVDITKASVTGHSEYVNDYQKKISDRLNSFYNSTKNINELNVIFKEPEPPFVGGEVSITKNAVKFGILGLIIGLLVGLCIVVIRALRRNCIISDRQMSSAFELDLLSDCTNGHDVSIDILNSNIDLMTEEHSRIMLASVGQIDELPHVIAAWNEKSDRVFVAGDSLFDDPKTMDALQEVEAIVLAIQFGNSKAEDIQRILLKTKKLNKTVLGYVLV